MLLYSKMAEKPNFIVAVKQSCYRGGDQLRVIESYYNGENYNIMSPALTAIFDTAEATGGAIAGTSAGTDCQVPLFMQR